MLLKPKYGNMKKKFNDFSFSLKTKIKLAEEQKER